jgi:hypothetical protein
MSTTWIDLVRELGITSVPVALVLVVIAYLGRKSIESFFATTTELRKVELNKDLESYKAELSKAALSHQIRFSRLHNDRAEAILTMYEKLVVMEGAMMSLTAAVEFAGEPSKDEKLKTAMNTVQDFFNYFSRKEVLFDEGACKLMSEISDSYWKATLRLGIMWSVGQLDNPNLVREKAATWEAAVRVVEERVPTMKRELKAELRTMLGSAEMPVPRSEETTSRSVG